MKMMMSCREAVEAMGSERDLNIPQGLMLRLHLLMCGNCSKYRGQLRALREAVRKFLASEPELSDVDRKKLEERIITRLSGAEQRPE